MSQRDLLKKWREKSAATSRQIEPAPVETKVRPTSGQQRLWTLQQLQPRNPFYQYAHVFHITGEVNPLTFERAVDELMARHDILRANFIDDEAELELVVRPLKAGLLHFEGVRFNKAQAEAKLQLLALTPYDLAHDSLFRAHLAEVGNGAWQLILAMHHIIGDRSSLMVLKNELFRIYSQLKDGKVSSTYSESSICFRDYAYWRNKQKPSEEAISYWKAQLAGQIPVPSLPVDCRRPDAPTYGGGSLIVALDDDLSSAIRTHAQALDMTANVYFLAAFKVWLSRYGSESDICVGSPVSLRDRRQLEHTVGFMNETLALRSQLPQEVVWEDALETVKNTFTEAFARKEVEFQRVVEEVLPAEVQNKNPFFQHMFVF
ncbi:MAG: condensation domain-containing protein, partial [Bacteroidota bacterium]